MNGRHKPCSHLALHSPNLTNTFNSPETKRAPNFRQKKKKSRYFFLMGWDYQKFSWFLPPAHVNKLFRHPWPPLSRSSCQNPTMKLRERKRHLLTEPVFLNVYEAQELIPRNEFRQPMQPGGLVRKPYSSSVPSPLWLFKNSSSVHRYSIYLPDDLHPEAGISKNYCATNPGISEVEVRFCSWLIVFKY